MVGRSRSSAVTRPSSIRSVVVLPAPLGPRNPVTVPGSTVEGQPVDRPDRPELLREQTHFDHPCSLGGCRPSAGEAGQGRDDEAAESGEVVATLLYGDRRQPEGSEGEPGLVVAVDRDEQRALGIVPGGIDAEGRRQRRSTEAETAPAMRLTAPSQPASPVPEPEGHCDSRRTQRLRRARRRTRRSAGTIRRRGRRARCRSTRRRGRRRSPACRCRGGRRCRSPRPARPPGRATPARRSPRC